jgi:putative transposase
MAEAQPIIPPDLREKPRSPVNSNVRRHELAHQIIRHIKESKLSAQWCHWQRARIAQHEAIRPVEPGLVDAIRKATNGNFALGETRFGEQIAQALGRRAVPGRSSRPRKEKELESRRLF